MLGGSMAAPYLIKYEENKMTREDMLFLQMLHEPSLRVTLLGRLEKLGLLSSFLEVWNETMPESVCHNQTQ